jgi:hypothetical protein
VKTQLHGAGLVERSARRGAHRRKRERKPCKGMMLHQDGLRVAWLPGQPELDRIVTMDDATSTVYSAFLVEEEGTASTFQALLEVFGANSLPSSFYTDRGSHYFFTPKAGEAVDKERLTQADRALQQLGIEHIPAYSPEARGRSERMFGTLQDRLAKELALAGITSIEAANRFIREVRRPTTPASQGPRRYPTVRSWPPTRRCCARPSVCRTGGSWPATTLWPTAGFACNCRQARRAPITSRPASRCASIRMARSPCSTAPAGWRATTRPASSLKKAHH